MITEKHINAEKDFLIPDLTAQIKYFVGKIASIYYISLINYFSSLEFAKAIKEVYAKEKDNLTENNN